MTDGVRPWSRAGLVLAAVLLVDQVTKALVRADVELGSSEDVFPLVDLVHVRNRGVAFGAFEDSTAARRGRHRRGDGRAASPTSRPISTGRWSGCPPACSPAARSGTSSTGSARAFVTDFVKLPSWPAFNVADMAITVGVLALVLVRRAVPPATEAAVDDRAREHA